MAFKAFQIAMHSDDTALPWTEEYISTNPDCIGNAYDVKSVRLTQKGMMIATDVAKAFIYKSHQTYSHVTEFLDGWGGKKIPSPLLQVKLTTSRPFVILGVDDARNGIWSPRDGDSWRQAYATVSDNPSATSNPLPLPPSSGSHVPSNAPAGEIEVPAVATPTQTSQDLPLEEPGRHLNGAKGRNTRQKN